MTCSAHAHQDSSVPTASISAWFGSLRCRKPQPNPTTKNLCENFCILALCAFPGVFHPDLVLPPPCIKVSGYCNRGLQAICPNPHATPTVGHGVRQPLPTVCPIHRSHPPAAILQSHVAMLQQFTHFHCHLASPYHRLEAPRDSFFDAWGLPPGKHYSKRPNHGQERSWRAEVQSKKKYIQQLVYVPVPVLTRAQRVIPSGCSTLPCLAPEAIWVPEHPSGWWT